MTNPLPQQQVVLDGAALMAFVMEAPNDPNKVVLESWQTGPMVVDRSRIQLLA